MTEHLVRSAIVVAGGSGIGAASARALAAKGYGVAILSPSGRGAELAATLGGVGLAGSNRSTADLAAIVDLAMQTYGRIDAVVCSSGHAATGPVLELTDEQWVEGMELYLLAVIRMARLVTPHLAETRGAIVNISTASPFEPNPRYPISATFRAGLAAFTKLYTDEVGPLGVRMNNVLPGWTREDPTTIAPEWTAGIPLRRAGAAHEVAALVAFLLSDEAAYITGQNIRIDGGAARSV